MEWLGSWADQASFRAVAALLFLFGVVETLWPARARESGIVLRWCTNVGLHLVGQVAIWALGPAAFAAWLIEAGGLDWRPVAWLAGWAGDGAALIAGVLLLDLYAYAAHRASHAVFVLWRLHAVHHADVEMDVSTAVRHHPLEVLLVSVAGIAVFAALGIPGWIVSVYGLAVVCVQAMQHANFGRAGRIDRALRLVFVTPGLHRVHHSIDPADHDMNYGALLSVWDRLFGTYLAEPALGAGREAYGVAGFAAPEHAGPHWAVMLPARLRRSAAD